MTKKKVLQIAGIVLLMVQLFKYLKTDFTLPVENNTFLRFYYYAGYLIGCNIYLILGLILFGAGVKFKKEY